MDLNMYLSNLKVPYFFVFVLHIHKFISMGMTWQYHE